MSPSPAPTTVPVPTTTPSDEIDEDSSEQETPSTPTPTAKPTINVLSWWYIIGEPQLAENNENEHEYNIRKEIWERIDVNMIREGSATLLDRIKVSVESGSNDYDIAHVQGSYMMNLIYDNLIVPYDDFVPQSAKLWNPQTTQIMPHFQHGKNGAASKTWSILGTTLRDDGMILGVNMDIIRRAFP